jgi:predicted signal transduction protein with EAL and GGDEF domain
VAEAAMDGICRGAKQTSFEFVSDTQGGERCFEVYLAPGGSDSIVALVRDYTERCRAQAEIRKLEHFDQVTGLPNGDMLHKRLSDMVKAGLPAAVRIVVMRLEVSGLDYARSLLGNRQADVLIQMCAERLRHSIEPEGGAELGARCLVGRIRDAGFLIVRDDLDDDAPLHQFAQRVLDRVTGSYIVGDYEISVDARLGIAVTPGNQVTDAGDLFDRAELAMGEGKSTPVFWSTKIRDRWRDRAHLTRELQTAVSNGDLHLEYQPKVDSVNEYQPKVDSVNRRLVGVEALARWQHHSHGAISPGVFIPLAEENGLILSIGEFVVEEACRQIRVWNGSGRMAVPVAVNFSGHQFNKQGLLGSLKRVLGNYAVAEGGIEIELTETVAMHSCTGIEKVLQDMHDIGIHTAIDDFGIRHSSLDNLRKYRFDTLKIDRSFTSDLQRSASSRSLISGIIGMGHALGMIVVAEGVEREEQLDFLREQHCDLIQGYLTGRPMPPDAIEPKLQLCGAA